MFSIQKGKFGMKKLMFSLLVCGSLMAFAEEPAPAAKAPDAAKVERRIASQAKMLKMSVEEFKALTPDQVKTKLEELKAERQAKRYGVSTYAQYLVLDAAGDIIHRICGGAKPEAFRASLSDALSDATSLRGTRLRVESGRASAADTVAYLRALRTASEGELFTRIGKDFAVRQEPEKYLQPDYWTFAVLAMRGSERHLNYLVGHRAAFVAAYGAREYENMVESVLANRILPWAQGSQPTSASPADLQHLLQMIRAAELPPYLPTAFLAEMAALRQDHRWLDIQLLWDERGDCLKKYPTVYKTLQAKITASGQKR